MARCKKCGRFTSEEDGAAPFIAMHPAVASEENVKVLRDAGHVVVVGEPRHFKHIEVVPMGAQKAVFQAALGAIKNDQYSSVRKLFGEMVADALIEED